MRKLLLLAAAAGALVTAAAAPAITFGENDNGRHPFVGSLHGQWRDVLR